MTKTVIWTLIIAALAAIAVAVLCNTKKEEQMAPQETYTVTKISVSPPVSHQYGTLDAALAANVASPLESPLPRYRLDWAQSAPGVGEYTLLYGCEAYGNPTQSPQMIRWFVEYPEGGTHTSYYSWEATAARIVEIDAENHG